MDVHLGSDAEIEPGNHPNGSSAKTVLTPDGTIELSIPRDRHGRFDAVLIAKYRRRFPGFDDKISALYARGMSAHDIQTHVPSCTLSTCRRSRLCSNHWTRRRSLRR